MADDLPVRGPAEWVRGASRGGGPFTTHVTWRVPEGGTVSWVSRRARKRGQVERRDADGTVQVALADQATATRLRRLNWVGSIAFVVGGSLFCLGALIAQVGSGDALSAASVYLAGGVFFSIGGYASLLGAINAPRHLDAGASLSGEGWRWWSYEPMRIEWAATFVLFAGTLAFGISLIDSFFDGLSAQQTNRLIWTPEMIGCVMFLVSGHLSMVEVCHGRPRLLPGQLDWWIVFVNQVGSALFFISALAALTNPSSGDVINVDVANWGTFGGAACFVAGGVLQAFERPSAPKG